MIQKLDEIPGVLDIQEVVIENQPILEKSTHEKYSNDDILVFYYAGYCRYRGG